MDVALDVEGQGRMRSDFRDREWIRQAGRGGRYLGNGETSTHKLRWEIPHVTTGGAEGFNPSTIAPTFWRQITWS